MAHLIADQAAEVKVAAQQPVKTRTFLFTQFLQDTYQVDFPYAETDDDGKAVVTELLNSYIEVLADKGALCAVLQIERCPNTQQLHLQGCVVYKSPRAWRSVRSYTAFVECEDFKTAHVEPARSQAQALNYCRKEESRWFGPLYLNQVQVEERCQGRQGKRTDLELACELIQQGKPMHLLATRHASTYVKFHQGLSKLAGVLARPVPWRPVDCFLFYGPTLTRKTTRFWNAYMPRNAQGDPDIDGDQAAPRDITEVYSAADFPWFSLYDPTEHTTLLIDDGDWSKIKPARVLTLLQGRPTLASTKGGHIQPTWNRVFVCDNHHPSEWWPKINPLHLEALTRRFKVIIRFEATALGILHHYEKGKVDDLPVAWR